MPEDTSATSQVALAWRQYRLERRLFWRNPSAAFFNLGVPLLFFALFGAIFAGDQDSLNILVPGIAGMSIVSTTFTALAHNMVALREQGVLKRIRGTPLPGGTYLAGLALHAITNTVVQIAIVLVIGRLVFDVDGLRDPTALVVFVVVGVVCFASLGVAFSHLIPSSDAAPAYVNAVFLPLIFISGVFYDPAKAPGFLVDIAEILPLVHLVEGLRGAMVTGAGVADEAGSLAVLAVWTAFGVVFAVRGFSWEARRA